MQNIISSFAPNQNQNQNANDMPWLFVTGSKFFATFAGIVSILFGALDLLFSVINFECFAAGLILIGEGLIITLIESPCLCMFLDFAYLPNKFFEGKSLWFKATIYLLFSIVPFSFCSSATITSSCFLIFVSSALYLVLALGKKATAEEMRAKAVNEKPTSVLVNSEVLPGQSNPPQSTPFYKNSDLNNTNFTSPPQLNTKNDSLVY